MASPHVLAVMVAKIIEDEGGLPGSSLHSWRCEHPDRYGPCTCVMQTAEIIVDKILTVAINGGLS